MKRVKVVLIGAGSAVFTRRLVSDLLFSANPDMWEIALVDIDEEALTAVTKLIRKIMAAAGITLPLTSSLDRRDVLPGARFVVTTIAVGKRRAWEKDIDIPRQYGIYQSVGDTTMPGGISRAMRMIPAVVDIARDVDELCPEATFLNYSNPMTMICRAVRKATDVPVVGLCHGMKNAARYLANYLGVEQGAVKVHGIGINHLTYLTRISVHGEDAFPAMRAEYLRQKKDFPAEIQKKKEWTFYGPKGPRLVDNPFGWEIFDNYGVYPIPPDRHIAEYYPERFVGGAYYGGKLGVNAYSIEKTIEEGDRDYEEMVKLANSNEEIPRSYYEKVESESEQLVGIMESLLQDGEREFSVNMPNTGFAPQLPMDAVLETSASAQLGGFVPLAADPLPDDLVAKLKQRIETVELTVDAALSGDEKILVEALLLDGSVTDRSIAQNLAKSLIDAHRSDLPQFAA